MKTSNYFAKLPQEASIKSIQTFRDYDLITLNLPAPRQGLCPRCGSTNCVIKDSGVWQTVRHLPSHHRGTAVAFHKRRLFCKECHTSFYENPYWVHPSLHMTQALYDSILLDLTEPLSFSEIARHHCVTPGIVQSVFETVRFGLPKKLPETICIDEFRGNSGIWGLQSPQMAPQQVSLQHLRRRFPHSDRYSGSDHWYQCKSILSPVFSGRAPAGEIFLL